MDLFHRVFIVLFTMAAAIRLYYHYQARIWQGERTPEGALAFFFRAGVGLPALAIIVVYAFRPQVLDWAAVPLPPPWRWVGAALFAAALPLLVWIQTTLGKNYSPQLRIRTGHFLVTSGPYRFVRHPMYTTSLIIYAAMGLLCANWFIGGTGVAATLVIMLARTPREEAMLSKAFGEQYRRYMDCTGRFLPRWRIGHTVQ
jgi:protein-S-isoprenylcysteine O-methyltransferase Ste14